MQSLPLPLPQLCAASRTTRGLQVELNEGMLRQLKRAYFLPIGFSFPDISPNAFAPSAKHLSGFWPFLGRSMEDPPIESHALGTQPVNLPSPNSAERGKPSIYQLWIQIVSG